MVAPEVVEGGTGGGAGNAVGRAWQGHCEWAWSGGRLRGQARAGCRGEGSERWPEKAAGNQGRAARWEQG